MGWLALLFTLLFSIISPMFSVELDIYQKLIDDLDYEDPRVPRVSEKVRQQMKETLKQMDQEEAVIQGGKKETDQHSHATDANIHPGEASFDNKKSESKGDIAEESIKPVFDSSQEMEVERVRERTERVPEVHKNYNLDETVFFKQFIRRLSDVLTPLQTDSNSLCAKVVLKRELYDELQVKLDKDSSAKEILDLFTDNKVFHQLEDTAPLWKELLLKINIPAVSVCTLAILGTLVLLVITKYLFFQEMYWKRNLVFVLFIGFLCSIPWEWYRMYLVELSKKVSVSQQDIPPSCRPNEINVFQSISLILQDKFTFGENDCAKYHESLLVDPIWEVSPLDAVSNVLFRFLFSPMKMFSKNLGISFRLFFKEIPVQWQPFFFLAIILIIAIVVISCSGLRIELPFLKINVNPPQEVRTIEIKKEEHVSKQIEPKNNESVSAKRLPSAGTTNSNEIQGRNKAFIFENLDKISAGINEIKAESPTNFFSAPNSPVQSISSNGEKEYILQADIPRKVIAGRTSFSDTQLDGRNMRRNVPSESDYQSLKSCSPVSQDENDVESTRVILNALSTLSIDSSGSIVCPNDSSVFSMAMESERSTSEIRRRLRRASLNEAQANTGSSNSHEDVENISSTL